MESRNMALLHHDVANTSDECPSVQGSHLSQYLRLQGYKYFGSGSYGSVDSTDTFDHDDDDDFHSNLPSLENIYETRNDILSSLPNGASSTRRGNIKSSVRSLPEVTINIDSLDTNKEVERTTQEQLLDVLRSLKDAIAENTTWQQRSRSRRRAGQGRVSSGVSSAGRANNGFHQSVKDDKMNVRRDKVIVELRVVFLKVGEIDTLKEQYSADTFIQAKWREPALDGKSLEELKGLDLDKFWNPLLYIENILSETKEATWLTASVNHKNEAYVLERRRIRGIFMENLELNDFPLDCQDLTITITSERPDTEIDLIPDENEMSGINVQTFVDQQEWRLHEHIEVSKKMMTQEYSSSNRCHPAMSVTCRASRRPGYFYWNVFLVMFFISALSFATFAVSPVLPQSRLQLSFTLFLTSVAFKFVINQSLPKISYLTYMDKYVLLSLAILCVVSIWHAVVTIFATYGNDFLMSLERDVFITFVIVYILCHVVFIFWLYFDACKRRRMMKTKDREYLEFLAKKKEWLEKTRDASASRRHSTMLLHSVHAL